MVGRAASKRAPSRGGPYAGQILGGLRRAGLSYWVGGVALLVILIVIAGALLAPWIAPYPDQGAGSSNLVAALAQPGPAHWFGTDEEGRDLVSRVLFGARVSLGVSFVVVVVAIVIGVALGATAGYVGGLAETVLMRATDFFLAFPSLLLALAIAAIIGPSLKNMIIALMVSWWPWYARLVHDQASVLRNAAFVRSARVTGVRTGTILWRHIIPNTLTPVLVQGTSDIGSAIISAAALSFLGLGVQPPTADWGSMVSTGREYILAQWWYATFPGAAIFVTAMAFNLLGDTLRDATDATARRS
jgi:peptide/nickel transport system permease protein